MFGRLLVGLDGSPLAETILPYVRTFAEAFQAQVMLLHVVHLMKDLPEGPGLPTREGLASSAQAQAQAYLDELRDRLAWSGVTVGTSVLVGDAATEIVGLAQRDHYDLIALATHGRSGMARLLAGSVAEKVMHSATTPVLLIQPTESAGAAPRHLTHVLVPLDGSRLAESALPVAESLAAQLHLPLVLLEVVEIPVYAAGDPTMGVMTDYAKLLDLLAEAAVSYLGNMATSVEQRGLHATIEAPLGFPASEIERHAARNPGALIVIATHGRSGIVGDLLGSVARQVLRADAPTVIIRPLALPEEHS